MPPPTTAVSEMPVRLLMRWARPAAPDTRVGEVTEMLRVGPYRLVPVVDQGLLVGIVSEATLLRPLLDSDDSERHAIRLSPIADWMEMPEFIAGPEWVAGDLLDALERWRTDTVPVVDHDGTYLGVVAGSDLIADLTRVYRPPQIGGMATLRGVYLTTGAISAGQGVAALMTTGAALFGLQFGLLAAFSAIEAPLVARLPAVSPALAPLAATVAGAVYLAAFLLTIRLSPVAGYHAAEHQVVHAIERGEPLLLANVRAMPRVHPRCGTNFLAAGILLTLGSAFTPWLGNLAYAVSGLLALTYWRVFGAWLQQRLTTRPASDAQLQSAIATANALLAAHGRRWMSSTSPLLRLWRMGIVQIAAGFCLAAAALATLGLLFPPLGFWLRPLLKELLTN